MAGIEINRFGEIFWGYLSSDLYREREKLQLGLRDWHTGNRYVTWPESLEKIEMVIGFVQRHQLEVRSKIGISLEQPQALMEYFFSKRIEMSWAEDPQPEKLTHPFPINLTPSQMAAADYATHTHCCFIADIQAVDRRAAALGAIEQADAYPCILVLPKTEREAWIEQCCDILPSTEVLNLVDANDRTPKKSIWLVEYSQLEQFHFPFWLPYQSVIIDHADFIKNPDAKRSQKVAGLARPAKYRFLLTDFPVNLSPADLREPLRILGKQDSFADLQSFLAAEPPDPLDASTSSFLLYKRQQKLEHLYRCLRATCLVRRGNNPGLQIRRQVENVKTTQLPEKFQPGEIKNCLRELGLQKTAGVIEWLWKFVPKIQGKILIVAHHNDVVEALSAGLNIPAIYRKVGDSERCQHWKDFLAPNGPRALVLSAKAALPESLSGVTALVLVELIITPQQLSRLVSCILDKDPQVALSIHHLVASGNPLDLDALARLDLRLENIEIVLGRNKTRD
jgi:hypothetical protein